MSEVEDCRECYFVDGWYGGYFQMCQTCIREMDRNMPSTEKFIEMCAARVEAEDIPYKAAMEAYLENKAKQKTEKRIAPENQTDNPRRAATAKVNPTYGGIRAYEGSGSHER